MRKPIIGLCCVALAAAGCAKRSDDVAASYQSPRIYDNWDCAHLAEEEAALRAEVLRVAGDQDDAAARDAVAMGVGLVVFWPALFLLAAGDDEAKLSDLKGRHDAVSSAMTGKGCAPARTVVAADDADVDADADAAQGAANSAADAPAQAPAAPEPEGPRPVEGARLVDFTPAQMKTWCDADWEERIAADGRTEYNPCHRRDAFL